MAVTVHIGGASYTGDAVEEVIRREYGVTARAMEAPGRGGQTWGAVVDLAPDGSWKQVAVIDHVTGIDEDEEPLPAEGAKLEETMARLADINEQRRGVITQRNELIRALTAQGVPIKKITEISGMSRSQVNVINRQRP